MAVQEDSFVLGIDVGSTKVCALIAREQQTAQNKTLEILGIGKANCDGVKNGVVTNPRNTGQAIREAVGAALEHIGDDFSGQKVLFANLNIGGNNFEVTHPDNVVTCKYRDGSNAVEDEDILELFRDTRITWLSSSLDTIHLLPIEFMVDSVGGYKDPLGEVGRKLGADFTLIRTKKENVNNLITSLSHAHKGLTKDNILLSPLATGLSLLSEADKKEGVALVDIGGSTTDIAIYHEGILRHVAILPFGGRHITADIAEFSGLSFDKAEKVKMVLPSCNPEILPINHMVEITNIGRSSTYLVAKDVLTVIRARLREIAAQVLGEIKRSGYEHKLTSGIVLTGGTSKFDGISEVFSEVTNMKHVIIGKPLNIEERGMLYKDVFYDNSYNTALGLAWSSVVPLDARIPATDQPLATEVTQSGKKGKAEKLKNRLNMGVFFTKAKEIALKFVNDDIQGSDRY